MAGGKRVGGIGHKEMLWQIDFWKILYTKNEAIILDNLIFLVMFAHAVRSLLTL